MITLGSSTAHWAVISAPRELESLVEQLIEATHWWHWRAERAIGSAQGDQHAQLQVDYLDGHRNIFNLLPAHHRNGNEARETAEELLRCVTFSSRTRLRTAHDVAAD